MVLNYLGNYLAKSWSQEEGCLSCWDNTIEIPADADDDAYPTIVIALFIEKPTAFLEEFFEKIASLKYPKSKLYLFIHNRVAYHEQLVDDFLEKHSDEYRGTKMILSDDEIDEVTGRNLAMYELLQLLKI